MRRRSIRRFVTALGAAAMVGLRDATGLAPPPPELVTEEIEWLSPESDGDEGLDVVLATPTPYVPQPRTARRATAGAAALGETNGLVPLRGWLLGFLILLVPSGLGSLIVLLLPAMRAAETGLGIVTLSATAAGNLTGLFLILRKSRITPTFFSLYLPALLALNVLNPDLVGTANARLAAMGSADQFATTQIWGIMAANTVLVTVAVGYWIRSQRVLAAFGTRGIDLILGRKRG